MKDDFFVKILVVFLFCVVFEMGLNAQNMFSKGDNILNLGVGIGSTLGGTGYATTIPPISFSYERGVIDELFDDKSSLGIGAYFGYAASKWSGYTWSYTILGARGAVHYQLVDKLDTYGGLMLGYNNASVSGGWVGASASELIWSLYLGGRYYFKDSMAAFAELGYGIAYLQLGISLKF